MDRLKKNIPAILTLGALLATTSVAALAQSGDGSDPRPDADSPQATSIEQEASDAMAVLRRPRVATDSLPTEIVERLDVHADYGMNPELSRRSIVDASNSLYVVPGSGYVCVALTVGEGVNGTCAQTADLVAGRSGAATVTLPGGPVGIYGLVPDEVDSVVVATGESSTTTIEAVNNAYFIAVPEGTVLRSVSYAGPSGTVAFPIYDPALAMHSGG
ncbi:MAG TPA: hypothetical protein VEX36_05750 [Thermoleophilaceae bacterium]|nr:hypothetical protein [Thermoleophilaceae bacterium]